MRLPLVLASALVLTPAVGAQTLPPGDVRPGDVLADHGIAVEVPMPGFGVTAHSIEVDGDQELSVETRWDGTIVVSDWGDESEPGDDLPSAAPGQCVDDEYKLRNWEWRTTFRWDFNAGSTPSEITVSNAEQAMRDAVRNIVNAENTCDPPLPDDVQASAAYQGRSSRATQINSGNGCQDEGNGWSTVAFGNLQPGTLGFSCVWHSFCCAHEGDVRLNTVHFNWVVNFGSNCQNKWSVEAVMTHERGHTFGLRHAEPEADHKWLTMSPHINGPCQKTETTLGLGDVIGLNLKY